MNEMQISSMPGRGTAGAIFVVGQLQEKYLGKKKKLYTGGVDLEKSFEQCTKAQGHLWG